MSSESSEKREAGRLGDYELISRLAVGGMAEIYEARKTSASPSDPTVVLKVPLPQLGEDQGFIEREQHGDLTVVGVLRLHGEDRLEPPRRRVVLEARAAELRREGYRVRLLGEGSNGGTITHPAEKFDRVLTKRRFFSTRTQFWVPRYSEATSSPRLRERQTKCCERNSPTEIP